MADLDVEVLVGLVGHLPIVGTWVGGPDVVKLCAVVCPVGDSGLLEVALDLRADVVLSSATAGGHHPPPLLPRPHACGQTPLPLGRLVHALEPVQLVVCVGSLEF